MVNQDRYDEVDRLRELNVLLLDNLQATVVWIGQYSQRTATKIPNLDSLVRLMKEGMKLLNEMVTPIPRITLSDASYHNPHSDASDDNLPKPESSNA